MDLLWIRHAEPERIAGGTGVPANPRLTERGQQQAQRLADWLAHEHVDVVLSSPQRRAQETALPIARAHGLEVQVVLERGYPVTVNDPDFATFAAGVASELIGDDRTITLPHPVMGAEDFSYVLERLPGTMMFLGATPPGRDPRTAPPNHSNRVTFDDRAMSTGIALHTAVALRHLC